MSAPAPAPRISLVLLAYRQEAWVEAAARSVLAQEGEPIEIVLSDDASPDRTFEVLQDVAAAYRGPHRVRARRNAANLGIGAHWNRLVEETAGELLVCAAGDDLSLPHRVRRLAAAWDASGGTLDLVASHYLDMELDGTAGGEVAIEDLGALSFEGWLARRPFTLGATHLFTRRLMRRFGPFLPGLWYEDPVVALRALLSGGCATVPEPLIRYRRGGTSKVPHAESGAVLRGWIATQAKRVLVEIAQFEADADRAGRGDAVRAALARTAARERYLLGMAEAAGPGDRARAWREAAALPAGWRLRKGLTCTFPAPAAALKRAKHALSRAGGRRSG
jgi:hypothetical protein